MLVVEICIVAVLIILNGLLAMSELAIVSSRSALNVGAVLRIYRLARSIQGSAMTAYLQFLTGDSTVLGITFQNWVPVVVGILILWVGMLASKL